MPRNSSGSFTLTAGNPVVPDTLIATGWANPTLSDIAQAITDSLDRNGRGGMLAPLKFADGTVTGPGITFNAESSTGFYRPGTGQLAATVTGTEAMRIFGTGDIVVGGVTDNGFGLEVVGTTKFDGNSTFGGNATVGGDLSVTGTATITGALTGSLTGAASLNVLKAGDTMTGSLIVNYPTAGQSAITLINNNAGTTSAAVFNASNGTAIGQFGMTGTGYTSGGTAFLPNGAFLYNPSSGGIALVAGASATIRLAAGGLASQWTLNTDGSVSQTVSGAVMAMHNSTAGSGGYTGWQKSGVAQGYIGSGQVLSVGGGAGDFAIRVEGNLLFDSTGGTERMRMDSSGNFGVGLTPVASSGLLQIGTGTANPTPSVATLQGYNNAAAQLRYVWNNPGQYAGIGQDAAGAIILGTAASVYGAPSQLVTVKQNSLVGFGTNATNPSTGAQIEIGGSGFLRTFTASLSAYLGSGTIITGSPATALGIRCDTGAIYLAPSGATQAMAITQYAVAIGNNAYVEGGTPQADLCVRNAAQGGCLVLSNKTSSGSVHTIGSIAFDAYRDVASPSYVAMIWASSATPAGNAGSISMGVAQNNTGAYPNEMFRMTINAGEYWTWSGSGGLNGHLLNDGGTSAWASQLNIGSLVSGQATGAGALVALGATFAASGTNYIAAKGQDGVVVNIQYGVWRCLGQLNGTYGIWVRVS